MTTEALAKTKKAEIALLMSQNMKSLESVLPNHMDSKRFCRMAINCLMKNPDLVKCDPNSFVMSVINCGEMGLEPSLNQAALVPYNGLVTAQPMYQGLIALALRSGKVANISAEVVYTNDTFVFCKGLEPKLEHIPTDGERGALRACYAIATLANGSKQFDVLMKSDVDKIKASAPGSGNSRSPWKKWESEQWKKSAVKRLCKYLPKSSELSRAMTLDSQSEAGLIQPPSIADMMESTLDVTALVEEPDAEPIQKPAAKKKGDSKKKPADAVDQDNDALILELQEIESKCGPEKFSEVRSRAGIDEAELVELLDPAKIAELIQLYKV